MKLKWPERIDTLFPKSSPLTLKGNRSSWLKGERLESLDAEKLGRFEVEMEIFRIGF